MTLNYNLKSRKQFVQHLAFIVIRFTIMYSLQL